MKICILFIFFGACKGMIFVPSPHCLVLPECYQYAYNSQFIDYYSTKRKKEGLSDYLYIIRGRCPTDMARCSSLK